MNIAKDNDSSALDFDSREILKEENDLVDVEAKEGNNADDLWISSTENKVSTEGKNGAENRLVQTNLNAILGYSVAIETAISSGKQISESFEITEPRNILVVVNTKYDRWIIENVDPNIIILELAQYVRQSQPSLKVAPIEMMLIAKDIGAKAAEFHQLITPKKNTPSNRITKN